MANSPITSSKQFSLNLRDAGKGVIVATVTAGIAALEQVLTVTPVVLNWKTIGMATLAGGVAYLSKNFFTTSSTTIKTDPPTTTNK